MISRMMTALVFRAAALRACRVLVLSSGALLAITGCQAPAAPTGPTEMVMQLASYQRFLDDSITLLRQNDFPPDFVDRTHGLIVTQPATTGQWFEIWRADSRGAYQTLESNLHTMRRVIRVAVEPVESETMRPIAEFDAQASATGTPARSAEANGKNAESEARVSEPGDASSRPVLPPDPNADASLPLEPPNVSGRFRVRVLVEKSRLTQPERQVTTASGAMGMYSLRTPTAEGERHKRDQHWVPEGRDGELEAWVLEQLSREACVQSAKPLPPS